MPALPVGFDIDKAARASVAPTSDDDGDIDDKGNDDGGNEIVDEGGELAALFTTLLLACEASDSADATASVTGSSCGMPSSSSSLSTGFSTSSSLLTVLSVDSAACFLFFLLPRFFLLTRASAPVLAVPGSKDATAAAAAESTLCVPICSMAASVAELY